MTRFELRNRSAHGTFLNWAILGLFSLFSPFQSSSQYNFLLMAEFEPRTSGVRSNRSAHCAFLGETPKPDPFQGPFEKP